MQATAVESAVSHYQHHLPFFDSLMNEEVDLKKRGATTRLKIRPSREAIRRHFQTLDLFDSINGSLLEAPLGGLSEGNELNCVDLVDAPDAHEVLKEEQTANEIAWSDEAIEQLHEAVLHYSLKLLQSRGNGVEKKEVLRWIFAPDLKVALLQDEHGQPVEVLLPQFATPFSFEQCCRICGYRSEKLQDELIPILNELGLGKILKEIIHATTP